VVVLEFFKLVLRHCRRPRQTGVQTEGVHTDVVSGDLGEAFHAISDLVLVTHVLGIPRDGAELLSKTAQDLGLEDMPSATTVPEVLHDRVYFLLEDLIQFRAVSVDFGSFPVVHTSIVEHQVHVVNILPWILILSMIESLLNSGQIHGFLDDLEVVRNVQQDRVNGLSERK